MAPMHQVVVQTALECHLSITIYFTPSMLGRKSRSFTRSTQFLFWILFEDIFDCLITVSVGCSKFFRCL